MEFAPLLIYYEDDEAYCAICLKTRKETTLIKYNATDFFNALQVVESFSPWLCRWCSARLRGFSSLRRRALRAYSLLTNLRLGPMHIQKNLNHYISELEWIKKEPLKVSPIRADDHISSLPVADVGTKYEIKKKRGRPKKNPETSVEDLESSRVLTPVKRKRGRPRKVKELLGPESVEGYAQPTNVLEQVTVKMEQLDDYDAGGDDVIRIECKMEPVLYSDEEDGCYDNMGIMNNSLKQEENDDAPDSNSTEGNQVDTIQPASLKEIKDELNKNSEEVSIKKENTKLVISKPKKKTCKLNPTEAKAFEHIEIFNLTEEERVADHAKQLARERYQRTLFKCEKCACGYMYQDTYQAHLKVHTKDIGAHHCDVCDTYHANENARYRHRLRHYRRYRCRLCGYVGRDNCSLVYHVMNVHAQIKFSCPHCPKKFQRPNYLKKHVEMAHIRPLSLECEVCHKILHEPKQFKAHMRIHNEEKRSEMTLKHPCLVCGKLWKTRSDLAGHMRRHNLGEPLACSFCHKPCKNALVLRQHESRQHTERVRKFQCDDCGKFFYTKVEVRKHISWTHNRTGGWDCERCPRKFRTRHLLNSHVRVQHDLIVPVKDKVCDLCGKAFADQQVMKKHRAGHTGEKRFPCPECGQDFAARCYMRLHYKLKHLNLSRRDVERVRCEARQLALGEPLHPVDSPHSVDSPHAVDSPQSGNLPHPVDTLVPVDSPHSVDSLHPGDSPHLVDLPLPVETLLPVDSQHPVDSLQPVDTLHPVDSLPPVISLPTDLSNSSQA